MYAVIAVNRAVRQTFHYEIPTAFIGRLQLGHLVEVEFGVARLSGVIVDFDTQAPVPKTKPILELLDPEPVLTPLQLDLAEWLAENTLAPIGSCIWLMLPPGVHSTSTVRYTLLDSHAVGNTPNQKRVLSLLKRRGALTSTQFQRALPRMNWRSTLSILVQHGVVEQTMLIRPPSVSPKTVKAIGLAVPPLAIAAIAPHLGRESKRANVLEVLLAAPEYQLPLDELMELAGCKESPIKTLTEMGLITNQNKLIRLMVSADIAKATMISLRSSQPEIDLLYYLASAGDMVDNRTAIQATGVKDSTIKRLAEDGIILLGEAEVWRNPLADLVVMPDLAPPLTNGQAHVWNAIHAYMEGIRWGESSPEPSSPHVFVVHGVTGSGKTEIYMRAVQQVLAQGRQAIVLVPEIALTAQLVQRFAARFPQQVAVAHSNLSVGERYDTWRRVRAGEVHVVVGARSALFLPLPDPGLIILDEEHDDSYKQGPPIHPPYYHARTVAIEIMRHNRGTVILGSATPDVTTVYHAQRGDYVLLRMPDRVLAYREKIQRQIEYLNLPHARYVPTDAKEAVSIDLPPIEVVDMRQELKSGNRSIFSQALQKQLDTVLEHQQQAILFLNRRGTATHVMCRDCGYVVVCSRCDTPLTYHAPREALICHHCGKHETSPPHCPNCNSPRIRYLGTGTEKIDQLLKERYPHARVLRWDQDTAKERGAHERILRQFLDRQADILVGTQMIAKGLDIPLVTLVGIISADTSLGLPDYRVGERTFQLLTQVAGRAGRGLLGGRVVLQTYQPDHYAIQAAAKHDYTQFYPQEIAFRELTRYPPFSRLARVLFRDRQLPTVVREAEIVADALRKRQSERQFDATEVIGPTPCFFMRQDGAFRWQILVRSSDPVAFFRDFELGPNAVLDIDPLDLL